MYNLMVKKLIWFYITDSSILQVKEEEKNPIIEETSSSDLTVFLAILIHI